MRKLIIAGMAVAMLAVPAAASAHGTPVSKFQTQTAKFEAVQPAGAYDQWTNLWHHSYEVTVNPCDSTFKGAGSVSGADQNGPMKADETITGSFSDGPDTDNVADHATYTATRPSDGVAYTVTAPLGTGSVSDAVPASITVNGNPVATEKPVEFLVSMPQFSTDSTTVSCPTEFISMAEIRNTLDIGVLKAQQLAKTGGITFTVNGQSRPSDDVKLLGATLGYNVAGITATTKNVEINGKALKSSRLAEIIAAIKTARA